MLLQLNARLLAALAARRQLQLNVFCEPASLRRSRHASFLAFFSAASSGFAFALLRARGGGGVVGREEEAGAGDVSAPGRAACAR